MASSSAIPQDAQLEPHGETASASVSDAPPGDDDLVREPRRLPDICNLEWQRQGMPDTEFNRKYPPDAWGEEAAPNARVWKVYRDHHTSADRGMLDSWNKTLDVLLIFAGLFSAVSTAFLIESYKALQPDYTQYVAAFLYAAAVSHERTGAVFPTLNAIVAPDRFIQASEILRWTNGLWFSSLIISLAVALFCILIKQWLDAYDSHISASPASQKYWAQRHCLYNRGLRNWGVPGLISFLPLLLHLSLFLFFIGLILFLRPLDGAISYAILVMVLCIGTFYTLALLLPAWRIECPSYTPLLEPALQALSRAISGLIYVIKSFEWIQWLPRRTCNALDSFARNAGQQLESIQLRAGQPLERENFIISQRGLELDGHVLSALINLPFDSNSGIVHSACAAIGAFTSAPTAAIIRREVTADTFASKMDDCYSYTGWYAPSYSPWSGFLITSHAQLRRTYLVMEAHGNNARWYAGPCPAYAPGLNSSLGIDGLLLQAMGVNDADKTQFDINILFRSLQSLPATWDRPAAWALPATWDRPAAWPLRSTCLLFLDYYARKPVDTPLLLSCFLLVFCAGRFIGADMQEWASALRSVETVLRKQSIFIPARNGIECDRVLPAVNGLWLMLADPERYQLETATAQMVAYQATEYFLDAFLFESPAWVHLSGLSAFCRSPNFDQCVDSKDCLAQYTRMFVHRSPSLAQCSESQVGDYWECIATLVKCWDRVPLSDEGVDLCTAADLFPLEPMGIISWGLRGPYSTLDDCHEPVLSAFLDGPNAIATWTGVGSTGHDHDDDRTYALASLARSISIVLCRRRRLGRDSDVFIHGFFSGTFLLARFRDIVSRQHMPTPDWKTLSFADIALDLSKHCLRLSPAGCLEICTQLEEMWDTDTELRACAVAFAQRLREGIAPGGALSAECSPDCPCMITFSGPERSWRDVWNDLVTVRFRRGHTEPDRDTSEDV